MLRVLPPAAIHPLIGHRIIEPPLDDLLVPAILAQIVKLRVHDPDRHPKTHNDAPGRSVLAPPPAHAHEDEELAISLFTQETEALFNAARDDDLLEELAFQEELEAYDHAVALAMEAERDPPPMPERIARGNRRELPVILDHDESDTEDSFPPPSALDIQAALKNAALGDLSTENNDETIEHLLSRLPHGDKILALLQRHFPLAAAPSPPLESCTVCGDDICGTVVRLKCGHTFDADCIQEMFKKASTDESLFPPKCCQGAVALSEVEPHLPHAFVEHYNKKAIEFSTPDRVYCHVPTCASFLGPAADAPATLRCAECAAGTCACCKEQTHPGVPCHFAAEDAVLDLGKEHGWQRCPACRHLVELSIGCYHIICRCSKQFCYVCAAPWKECECPLFYVPPE
ncbi:hypothetical protein C8Q79DRAFT_1004927 [Trametes meyenii]|nr:hypothetical protein C8Q79DRAFT_1004927 [Trametes meyenii]